MKKVILSLVVLMGLCIPAQADNVFNSKDFVLAPTDSSWTVDPEVTTITITPQPDGTSITDTKIEELTPEQQEDINAELNKTTFCDSHPKICAVETKVKAVAVKVGTKVRNICAQTLPIMNWVAAGLEIIVITGLMVF